MKAEKVNKVDLKAVSKRIFRYVLLSGSIIGFVLGILTTPYTQFASFNGEMVKTTTTPLVDYIFSIVYSMIAVILFLGFIGYLIILIIQLFNIIGRFYVHTDK